MLNDSDREIYQTINIPFCKLRLGKHIRQDANFNIKQNIKH